MRSRKLFSILLTLAMIFSMLPAFTQTANAADGDAPGESPQALMPAAGVNAEPTFTEVNAGDDAETLKAYLEMNGNIKINLVSDMFSQIGKAGDIDADPVTEWCTLGTGIKVLDLNGYDITVSQDAYSKEKTSSTRFYYMATLFTIPDGAEMVVNDTAGGGVIEYRSILKVSVYNRNAARTIFDVKKGGKLTVNNGTIKAGRLGGNEYCNLQTNGIAVLINGGDVVINGGRLEGRGLLFPKNVSRESSAAIYGYSGSLKIYGGTVMGNCFADALCAYPEFDISVYGGKFDVSKTDDPVEYTLYGDNMPVYDVNPEYGYIHIPARALTDVGTRTIVNKSGTGNLSAEEVAAGGTDRVSECISIGPVKNQTASMYKYDASSGTYKEVAAGEIIEWDKQSSLRFKFTHDPYCTHDLRSFDIADGYSINPLSAGIRKSPEGENFIPALHAVNNNDWVDLINIEAGYKTKLVVGNTYYVRMVQSENWQGTRIFYTDDKLVKIKIVEPALTMPDLSMGVSWENNLDSAAPPNQDLNIKLYPTGDGSFDGLSKLFSEGKFSNYESTWTYTNGSGSQVTTASSSDFNNYGVFSGNNFYRGISTVRFNVTLKKGSSVLGSRSVSQNVVFFPKLASSITPDSFGRVYVDPSASSKTVTLSCNANSYSGMFWAKNGTKISGTDGLKTLSVNVSGSSTVGWYGLGYTVDGTDYFSPQAYYIGVKDGTRVLSISASSASCTITSDSSTTPTITATKSGNGWGTISEYKWKNVSWPSGARPASIYRTTTANTITAGSLFCGSGSLTQMHAGTYVFSCTAYDSYGNEGISNNVSITVSRPATGIRIMHPVESEYHDTVDVTDGFIVLDNETGSDYISPIYTPENSVGSGFSYSSSNTGIATVSKGQIRGVKPGSATVTASSGSLSAKTRVLVPKIKYDITIPDEWLQAEAGGIVHRGTLSVPSGADFTAELKWYASNSPSGYDYEFTDDNFVGEKYYMPQLIIYPKSGVCYPVDIEYEYSRTTYYVDADRFEITVNGTTYYGATYCGRDYFFDPNEPVSSEASSDYIRLNMDPTEKLIDWRDEYLEQVTFSLKIPSGGDPKDMTEDAVTQLVCTIKEDGIINGGDSVMHVTDTTTIHDTNTGNDAVEDFTNYQEGETYRYTVWLMISSSYVNEHGGKNRFAETVTAVEHDLGAITGRSLLEFGMLIADVYFTVPIPEYQAEVNGVKYMTFAEAAAVANGSVITLLDDVYTKYIMREGEVLRIKKSGHNINVEAPLDYRMVTSLGADGVTIYEIIAAHDWGDPTYEWAADYSSVTATRKCKNIPSHVETETVSARYVEVEPSTCVKAGTGKWISSSFKNSAFQVQTKTIELPLGEHTPAEQGVTENLIPATCTENGSYDSVIYCTVCHAELSREYITTAALGHIWDEPSYEWAADNSSVTASRICKRDGSHVETEIAQTAYEVIKASTVSEPGTGRYTAVFKNQAFKTQSKDVEIPKLSASVATVTGISLDLQDKISVQFKIQPDDKIAYAELSVQNPDSSFAAPIKVVLDKNSDVYRPGEDRFVLRYSEITTKMISQGVKLTVYDKSGNVMDIYRTTNKKTYTQNDPLVYSAADWCNAAIDHYGPDKTQKTAWLAMAVLNLGGEAQKYFDNYNPGNPANPNGYLADDMVSFKKGAAYDMVVSDAAYKSKGYSGMTLDLAEETRLRVKFNVNVAATLDGNSKMLIKEGDKYVLDITGLRCIDLDQFFTVVFKGTDGSNITMRMCAISWSNLALDALGSNANNQTVKVAKAVALYSAAAENYFR